MKDTLHDREQAFEAAFFNKRNQELVDQYRKNQAKQEEAKTLAELTGIKNQDVLKAIIGLGLSHETLSALSCFPFVAVAWADGVMGDDERTAIKKALEGHGITSDCPAHGLIEQWLEEAPADSVFDAWQDYTRELLSHMDGAVAQSLRNEILDSCQKVAEATGGFLGLTSPVSDVEKAMIEKIQVALH